MGSENFHSVLSKWVNRLSVRHLDEWMNPDHGQLNFFTDSCFTKYLHESLMKVKQEICSLCNQGRNEGPLRTLFECQAGDVSEASSVKLSQSLQEIGVDEVLALSSLVATLLCSEEARN